MQAIGGVLAYPELGEVGDIDNAIISLVFASGRLGVVDLTRNGIYGYDITTELLGTAGHAADRLPARDATDGDDQGRSWRTTRCRISWSASATPTPRSSRTSPRTSCSDREPPITIDDGVESLRVAVAATRRADDTGQRVEVAS